MEKIFDIEKFNLISDDENYYFFRSLEPGDIKDLEKGIIKEGEKYKRIRTDRERWEETHQEKPRWNADSTITLEEIFNHIKMHYSLQTNCISLSSNANVVRTYEEAFSDKYVMIKVPKKEMGEKVFYAGQYMLGEIDKQIEQRIAEGGISENVLKDLRKIDKAKTSDEIKELIKRKYKTLQKLNKNKAHPRKGITYKSPQARISSWQSLNEDQTLEKNKIVAKLTVLEHKKLIKPFMPHSANNNLLIQTIGSAFASSEQIYYGDIEGDRIKDVSKEIVDMFGLLQQVEGQNKKTVDELKRELIHFVNEGKKIDIPKDSILKNKTQVREDISIEEMYKLTGGKVEYGQANSIVKNIFYLAKGQLSARVLADKLRKITSNDSKYEEIIKYIKENEFQIEPKISTRLSNKGYKLSESVNLNLNQNEIELAEQVKKLSDEEQEKIIQSRGLSNVQGIMTNNFSKLQNDDKISKERYYAEAIFSMYDWKKIGIEEFSIAERENLIQKIQEKDCVNLYKKLEQSGIKRIDIPTVLLNIITGKKDGLKEELSIERVERFLGYYDIPNTRIQLRPYQQRATERTDEILEESRFASVILPTGGGKSFVGLDQLMKHKDEKMLYLAPQNEILEQMKDYIMKYIHGPVNTLGKSKDEIVANIFQNIKFTTYPSLLSKEGEEVLKEQYDFIILDELHRTGASEWGDSLNTLLDNQSKTTKVLGITATPRRDADGKNMANEIAERLGYTNKEAISGKHIAMNLSLTNATRLKLVVNPKLVSCEYSLKTDGSLERLEEKINQIEDVKIRNERLEKYEILRRNLDSAKGIANILQANVKKGGKYIVFLPMAEDIEDEDGNVIGRKKGKDKINYYEKQIEKYFDGSEITPSFHSMLGEYGDKSNEKRLEEFQNRNTDCTEFLLVMNKANEGLHLEKLDGIIWLRPMSENSRILYLQQLGRIIYSEDPDNPTKDEDRPVVIDLANNTIKVNWEDENTEQDDIELMNIIIDWIRKHNEILPNINSNDREEYGYARVLKEIQSKYSKYLNNEFHNLSKKKIDEIKEILELGNSVELWETELPNRTAKDRKKHNRTLKNREGPFEITGILKDFIDLEKEKIEGTNSVERFINKMQKLKKLGIDVSKIKDKDTIQSLAQKSDIIIAEEETEKLGIKLDDKIGITKKNIISTYKGRGSLRKPTQEQKEILLNFGIVLDQYQRDTIQEFIEKLEILKEQGVDVSKIKSKDTIKKLAEKSEVEITEKQAQNLGIKLDDKIGNAKDKVVEGYKGKYGRRKPTQEQIQKILELGITIEREEKNFCEEFICKMQKLKELGIDVSKIQQKDTIEKVIKREGLEITAEQAEELGIELEYKIGTKRNNIIGAYRGRGRYQKLTQEQISTLLELGVSLEKRDSCQEFIEILEKLNELGVDITNIKQKDTIETLAQRSNKKITDRQVEKIGIDLYYNIGKTKTNLSMRYRGVMSGVKPTQEQVDKLLKLGIDLSKKRRTSKEIAEASISAIKDTELADKENKALQELVEKQQKKEEQK